MPLAHFGFRASDFLRFSLAREVFLLLHWADFGFRPIPTAFRAPLLAPREPEQPRCACLEWPADIVIYRSRLNAKINRNFEVFTATDFLAAITQHIPDKGAREVFIIHWLLRR